MNILEKIVAQKRREVEICRELMPPAVLEQSSLFPCPVTSLNSALRAEQRHPIIAEIKRKSPTKGVFHETISVPDLAAGYLTAGAVALSVLTDLDSFGGTCADLTVAKRSTRCPVLRKDFIIDEYQVIDAKSIGADAVLLIAAILTPSQTRNFAALAKSLGLEVVLEIHTEDELAAHLNDKIDIVGVNNRNLGDFEVSLERSFALLRQIPQGFLRIAESGIDSAETIVRLRREGAQGFLIGEAFMGRPDPVAACAQLIQSLKSL